ncbi:DUF2231 domain-containing protein [Cellulomonas palmilytica]|uniref:DUF2231 domain-containing protein n=1 Tax=Cellulomonas palmilytica TaxID=2608402 RepID=UPI001F40EE4F|nr:DUF2231 domain-containing protein [Cellulomonas palmilytica]UJP39624.1 DUF2231 domain-containing protein [Cellulomonas palmilytica]
MGDGDEVLHRSGRAARGAVTKVEESSALDGPAVLVRAVARAVLRPRALSDVLRGVPAGHAAHPPLTDVPIGLWVSASTLDLLAPVAGRRAADRLVGLGVLAAAPTALTGLADWGTSERSDPAVRRVGVVHGVANLAALACYTTSWVLRRRGRRAAGVLAGLAGGTFLGVGGYLGGHLALVRGAPHDDPLGRTVARVATGVRRTPSHEPTAETFEGVPMDAAKRTTTDHAEIRTWVEAQGGRPALVPPLGRHEPPVPAVIFPSGPSGHGAVPATWGEWFDAFDRGGLAFVRPAQLTDAPPFFELAQA